MASNFLVDSVPIQVNTLNETRKKTMMYIQGWCASYRHRKEKAATATSKPPTANALMGANSHLISSAFGKLGNYYTEVVPWCFLLGSSDI